MAKAFFVSDLHLKTSDEPNAKTFIKFLRGFKSKDDISHLFLLGDIFDLWVARHNYFIRKFETILAELFRLRDLGVKIHYFEGNHDLYLKHYFSQEAKFHVHEEAVQMNIAGRSLRIEHGDQMDPDDKGYLFLRKALRSPFMKWFAVNAPERFVVWLGERASQTSRTYTTEIKVLEKERVEKMIVAHVRRVGRETPFDILISGHIHQFVDIKVEPGPVRVINLGTWLHEPRAYCIEDGAEPRWVHLDSTARQ